MSPSPPPTHSRSRRSPFNNNNNSNNNSHQRSDDDEAAEEERRERYAGDYTSICLKNLNENIATDKMRHAIYEEFKSFSTNITVRIVANKKANSAKYESDLIAFVNYEDHIDARDAKRAMQHRPLFSYPLHIEPVFRSGGSSSSASGAAGPSSSSSSAASRNVRVRAASPPYPSSSSNNNNDYRRRSPMSPPPPPPPSQHNRRHSPPSSAPANKVTFLYYKLGKLGK